MAQQISFLDRYTVEDLERVIERYPWWSGARVALLRIKGSEHYNNKESQLLASLHPTSIIKTQSIDVARLTYISTDDLIDRFLKRDDYRIVAEEGSAEDLSAVEIEEEEDLVSEELAEIYLKQGLYSEAIDTYRKLSLVNSEKSIYFAGLIAEIESKITK